MDELGFLVTGVDYDGRLSFRLLGGIDERVLPGVHVEILAGESIIPGVIGIKPPHLQYQQEKKVVPWSELRIDVGAQSRKEALDLGIKPPVPVVFMKTITSLNRGRVLAARSLDDRVGVSILLALAERIASGEVKPRGRLALVWTVQEEVGLRGARIVAGRLKPSLMVAVDTMACCDPVINGGVRMGAGPVLRVMDNRYIAPKRAVQALVDAAERAGVEYQVASAGGTTDAAAFMEHGVPSMAIGILAKYAHSTAEMVNLDDVRNALELVASLVETYEE